ncbi:alpha/beta hydrolase family protein [Actinocrispum wychmicini]|uniref:Dipeptidyl aminopeptidase/acylaminoacyl peptidase n=1 Tax=Actinocrispum wychmicini TaxID=1213861 RepID=A0A4R2JPL6_9PSEU|nr:prolyl oligopeptidase family serine peptidase [Actinocrispum wychmicini]TCO60927.1 dipeptidyl aminopeptidase/acylaminoacyl peptidase [Actinocrispum wychmicini]
MREILPYGAWKSPVSAADAAAAGGGPDWVEWSFGEVWWAESRPTENGRVALVRAAPDGKPVDVLSAEWNVRNRLHEYGGRPWTRLSATQVVFTNWDDQRVYVAEVGGTPRPVSPEPQRRHGLRYGDLMPGQDGEVWCVQETVTGDLPTDIRRDLVALGADKPRVLGASHHFMTGPKISPDGTKAAWIGWDHPNMPWDGNELCVADVLADGTFGPHRVLAGGPREAVCQVEWEDAGHVLALTDPDGWWNLFRIGLDGSSRNLAPGEAEIGGALWRVGPRWFAALGSGRFAVLRSGSLAILDERSGTVTDVDTDLTAWRSDLTVGNGVVYSAAGSPTLETAVVGLDLSRGEVTAYTSQESPVDPAYLPIPQERVFPGPDGRDVPAYVYPPTSPDHAAPDGERPPYVVFAHGGPTSRFGAVLNLDIAFFTSRGIGVVAVNYGGSTGYGRAFRERLTEQWGVVDVQDCAAVAEALAAEGTADADRLAIQGGSAGGWTSAASMTSTRTYRCAVILYPVLDLSGWTSSGGETHDFESRYIEGLVGRLPEHADRYRDRSPAYHVDKLVGPVLLLQGLEDQVCPPEQANRFVASLAGTGVPHAYLTFEGEQHGFRRADSLITSLHAAVSFYGQVFGFVPPDVPVLELRS